MRPRAEISADRSSRALLTLASVAVLVAAADTYVVVLALPDLMVGVGLDADALQRAVPVVSMFLLGYIAVLPLIGRLSDLHGRRPVLVGSLLMLAVGSLLTAVATTLGVVVAGRFLQGVGGGGLVPVTLALVADLWPPERRGLPLGIVGAVQEIGSVMGPLAGAAVLAVADWRAIFWITLAGALILAALMTALPAPAAPADGEPAADNGDRWSWVLAIVGVGSAVLAAVRPASLVRDVTWGLGFVPLIEGVSVTQPVVLLALAAGVALVVRSLTTEHPLVDLRSLPALAREADLVGSLLIAVALGGVVLTFATADPAVQLVSPRWPILLGISAMAIGGALWRSRRAEHPLVPRGTFARRPAWGALVVSALLGAALIAPLVEVPVYARTALAGATQLDAALELVRLLIGVPIGALVGGWAVRHASAAWVAAGGLLVATAGLAHMTTWGLDTILGRVDDAVLVATGFGFGVAIAPVNVALLGATTAAVHGVAAGLVVVARMLGMLVGLSALTALGLRAFTQARLALPSPAQLCPSSPTQCRPYATAVREAALTQVQGSLTGAALCAALASVLSLVLLRSTAPSASSTPAIRSVTA